MDDARNTTGAPARISRAKIALSFFGIIVLLALGCFFLWHTKSDWQKYKETLASQGEVLDPKAFLPPLIPDEQNILKTPLMEAWAYKTPRGSGEVRPAIKLNEGYDWIGQWANGELTQLEEWRRFFPRKEFQATAPENESLAPPPPTIDPEVLSSIKETNLLQQVVITEAPLPDALRALARQAGISVILDTNALSNNALISLRLENVTPAEVLTSVLKNYNFILALDEKTKMPTVMPRPGISGSVQNILHKLDDEPVPSGARDDVVPVITVDETSLPEAIVQLARQANVAVDLDPGILEGPYVLRKIKLKWQAISPWSAFQRVMRQHKLRLVAADDANRWRVMSPEFSGAQEILDKLEPFAAEINELHEACRRPLARYDLTNGIGFDREMPNYIFLRTAAQSLTLHASAELALGRSEPALPDVVTVMQLAKAAASNPTLVGAMMGAALNGIALQPVWEGLAMHRWKEAELVTLQNKLGELDLMRPLRHALQAEIALISQAYDNLSRESLSTNLVYSYSGTLTSEEELKRMFIRLAPQTWLDEKQIACVKNLKISVDAIDLKQRMVSPARLSFPKAPKRLMKELENLEPDWSWEMDRAIRAAALNQTGIHEAMVACALERYRLAQGKFPETLEALVPKYIEQLPHDIIGGGGGLKYSRDQDGTFTLYSVGWNGKDEGGVMTTNKSWETPTNGDWVWRYPKP